MSKNYDNWERLVDAVIRKEEIWQLCHAQSESVTTESSDSNFSSGSRSRDDDVCFRPIPSPLHPDSVRLKLAQSLKLQGKKSVNRKVPTGKKRAIIWKGLSILRGGFTFTSKKDNNEEEAQRTPHGLRPPKRGGFAFTSKDYSEEEREFVWSGTQRTLHGPQPPKSFHELREMAELAKKRAEIARLRELHTLKGHFDSLVRAKGLDVASINHYYTV